MILIHAALVGDELRLWGEAATADGGGAAAGSSRDRRAGASTARSRTKAKPTAAPAPHPFDAGPERLADALDSAPGGFPLDPERILPIEAWLPSRGGQPVASRTLGDAESDARGRPALLPWRVSGAGLEMEEVVTFLAALPAPESGRRALAPGVVVATDLEFWRLAFRFAAELVVRQRYLPGLRETDEGWKAAWEPVLMGDDAARAATLARLMPPAARALGELRIGRRGRDRGRGRQSGTSATTPLSARRASASEAFRRFLDLTVDHLVRSSTWDDFEPPPAGPPSPSLDGRWAAALTGGDAVLAEDGRELGGLRRRLEGWRRPISVAADQPFRLCFRLEEPSASPDASPDTSPDGSEDSGDTIVGNGASAPGPWRLRNLLQSVADPSVIVPASELRRKGGARTGVLRALGRRAEEFLLTSLGQAAAVSPVIASALQRGGPGGAELELGEAYAFLQRDASLLGEAGFGVLLPSWWIRGRPRERPSLRARVDSDSAGSGTLSLQAIVNVEWEVVLGGETLSRKELERLARLKEPLLRVRGRWIEVDAEEIRSLLRRLRRGSEVSASEVLRMSLGASSAADGPAPVEVEATGWLGDLIARLSRPAALTELEPPARFQGTLRPYQLRGYAWLAFLRGWGLGACLADDMGLGKTVQTLALIQRDHEADARAGPVLLVCPTSVLSNWQREAERFTPSLPVLVHHGPGRASGSALAKAARRHALVLTSYALLHRDAEVLRRVRWRGAVLDEAQYVKNPDTLQARAARSLEAGYRVALTGTPVENHVGDLWSLMEFLNPGLLGGRAAFRRDFLLPIQARRDGAASERLRQITGPFVLRRVKTDPSIISDLPEKLEVRQYCTLTPEQASLYRAVLTDAERALESEDEGIARKGLILALLTRLKQVCNHPAHFLGDGSATAGRSGKLARTVALLEEVMEEGERALIFTQFKEMGGLLRRHLEETFGCEVLFLHGGVPRRRRDEMVERFQAGGPAGPPLFILSLRAGGTGLNLTGANHVFHFDRWWNPAVEDQATDRAFRIGQHRNVQVHKMVCSGTLEERIDDLIEGKKALAQSVVGAGEAWLTELDNERLRAVLALSDDAVSSEET